MVQIQARYCRKKELYIFYIQQYILDLILNFKNSQALLSN